MSAPLLITCAGRGCFRNHMVVPLNKGSMTWKERIEVLEHFGWHEQEKRKFLCPQCLDTKLKQN